MNVIIILLIHNNNNNIVIIQVLHGFSQIEVLGGPQILL